VISQKFFMVFMAPPDNFNMTTPTLKGGPERVKIKVGVVILIARSIFSRDAGRGKARVERAGEVNKGG
jgi:hypothetical protein